MLSYIDRIQMVVPDRGVAAARWKALFDAEQVGEDGSRALNAHRTTVRAGATDFEFLEPAGPGPAADFAAKWRQGLWGVGFATDDLAALEARVRSRGVEPIEEKGRLILPDASSGMPITLSASGPRERVGNVMRFVYEVTNPVADAQQSIDAFTDLYGLEASRYSHIRSEAYGYEGALTLFNPPAQLDRVEMVRTFGGGAMDRFYERRGPSLYMCYIETDDVLALGERLEMNEGRYANARDRYPETGLYIHPTALFGMLMGVSRTDFAWVWSGRPELAGPGAKEMYSAH